MTKFKCFDCSLSVNRRNIVLPEIVGEDPEVAFFGMGPGPVEDFQARPFVGPAGQLLRDSIKIIGLKNYQLINSVLCFLPNNDEPTEHQLYSCAQHWPNMLAPTVKVCVALGRVALRSAKGAFDKDLSIGAWRGILFNSPIMNRPCIATYHPSYILRNGGRKADIEVFLSDIKKAIHHAI